MTDRFNQGLALMAMLTATAGCVGEAADSPREQSNLIEFRMVQDTASEGSQAGQLDGERIHLAAQPVVSDADIREISPVVRSGQIMISMEFTEAGGQQIRRLTAENIGRRMALIIDGEVRSAPMIAGEIQGPLQVAIEAEPIEAERLAELIRARWP